jgi:hypothetical protein
LLLLFLNFLINSKLIHSLFSIQFTYCFFSYNVNATIWITISILIQILKNQFFLNYIIKYSLISIQMTIIITIHASCMHLVIDFFVKFAYSGGFLFYILMIQKENYLIAFSFLFGKHCIPNLNWRTRSCFN